MTTKLDKPLRREISIDGKPFVVTLLPEGFKLVGKGRRKGLEISWGELVSGEAALATALKASLDPRLNLDVSPSPRSGNGHSGTHAGRRRSRSSVH